jgi:hypothetical protein
MTDKLRQAARDVINAVDGEADMGEAINRLEKVLAFQTQGVEDDAAFKEGLDHLQAFAAREGHAQVPPDHIEPRITATEHTPGPWTVEEWHEGVTILDDGRETITEVKDVFNTTRGTAKANARLIAAAPALEDALGDALNLLEEYLCHYHMDGLGWDACSDGPEGNQCCQPLTHAVGKARAALAAAAPAAPADA